MVLRYTGVLVYRLPYKVRRDRLTRWCVMTLARCLFRFARASFKERVGVFEVTFVDRLAAAKYFHDRQANRVAFRVAEKANANDCVSHLRAFYLCVPAAANSMEDILAGAYRGRVSKETNVDECVDDIRVLSECVAQTANVDERVHAECLFRGRVAQAVDNDHGVVAEGDTSYCVATATDLGDGFPAHFRSVLCGGVAKAKDFRTIRDQDEGSCFLFVFSIC